MWGNLYRGSLLTFCRWYMDFVAIILLTQQVFLLTMLNFLLNPFNTWGYYYFESNFSLVWHINVQLIEKGCDVLYSSKHEETFFPHEFIFAFTSYTIGQNCQKICFRRQAVWKRIYKWGWPYRGGVSIEGWSKPAQYVLCRC